MLSASPITSQPVGKTFTLAISVLGVGAILQLGLIGWAFVNRARMGVSPVTVATVAPQSSGLSHITQPQQGSGLDLNSSPLAEPSPTSTTGAAGTTTSGLSRPVPVNRNAPATEPTNRFDELILQGKQLRDRGDMGTAITKFREASALDTKSPVPLNELATTYDKMGLADKAAEHWRKIYDMGDSAGVYYQVAEAKIKASQATALRNVEKSNTNTAATMPAQDTTPVDLSQPAEGIAVGSLLGLMEVRAEDERDDNSAKRFVLHIPIKARPKAHVDVRDLVIHVLFYDLVDKQNVVQTSANVSSRWATPPADWTDTDTEELAVEYQLPKPEPRAKREDRKYFGYIVRIYYKQQLQAATAEPDRLAQQYPPPPTLPKENDK
ncbi:MAG TPA: hypothetical protein VK961_10670 [Chthoniobacter sp.]|nr:hypothetical protein [Chthoniobacter sp.]